MTQPRGFPGWDELYRSDGIEALPWYWPAIDPDLAAALERRGVVSGRALDLGSGPGTQAIALAERGFVVTAADVSAAALAYAERKAKARGVHVAFVEDDILATKLAGPFDVIFDRGCFHVISPGSRADYARTIRRLLAPGGWFFLKTFSHLQPGTQGPHRFTPEDVRACFDAHGLAVVDVQETVYQGQNEPHPKALFTTIRRA
ncbi:MAG TPA: class I SAM-dependent methyltransferase [Polyangiaceae bacterium]|nr:class I SAM-dependent methyltransferase [Polyangiaceae bacterium]